MKALRFAGILLAVAVVSLVYSRAARADTLVSFGPDTRFVTGTAFDLATNDTLPGIEVSLWAASSDGRVASVSAAAVTTTGPQGDYVIPVSEQGAYLVHFSDPTGQRAGLPGLGTNVSQDVAGPLTMIDDDESTSESGSGDYPSTETTLTGEDGYLGTPWMFSPQVVDGISGDPLPGVSVSVAPYGTSAFLPAATTDASGAILAGPFPVTGSYWVALHDPSGVRPDQIGCDAESLASGFTYPALSGSSTSTPQIVMHEPGALGGNVTLHDDGSAVSGAPVQAWRLDPLEGESCVASTTADDGGHYSFPALPPGYYRVVAYDPLGEIGHTWSSGDDPGSLSGDDGSSDNSGEDPSQEAASTSLRVAADTSASTTPSALADGDVAGQWPNASSDEVFVADGSRDALDVELGADTAWDDRLGGLVGDPLEGETIGAEAKPFWGFSPIRPKAASRIRLHRSLSVSGVFHARTRHAGWMRVECGRFEHGRWVVRKALTARTSRDLNYIGYYAKIKLPKTGRWRIRVRWTTATSGHVWSKFRYVRVTH